MDELSPSLRSSARGGDAEGGEAGDSGSESSVSGETTKGATVIGRCAAAALGTGVDCVLDEEFSASREAARTKGFPQVRRSTSLQPTTLRHSVGRNGPLFTPHLKIPCHRGSTVVF